MLKTIFNSILFIALVLFFSTEAFASTEDIQQLAGIMMYVSADYSEAVNEKGEIKSEDEFAEQKNFLLDAKKLALEVNEPSGKEGKRAILVQEIEQVLMALQEKKPLATIQLLSRNVQRRLTEDFGLKLSPKDLLALDKTQALYQQNCASCHGTTGHADTAVAAALKPVPASFHDIERMEKVSPALAYHALTYGIKGTAMAAFTNLKEQERWSLAFYVISLRYQGKTLRQLDGRFREFQSLKNLAQWSDLELLEKIRIQDPTLQIADQQSIVATLRLQGLLQAQEQAQKPVVIKDRFEPLLGVLQQLKEAAQKGDMKKAKELSLSAYLDYFELDEKLLREKDPKLTRSIENLFMQDLHDLLEKNPVDLVQLENTLSKIRKLLKQANDILVESKNSFWAAFVPIFAITVREGFETVLLVGFLLAFLRKSGQEKRVHLVHVGWILAVGVGVITYFLLQWVIQKILLQKGLSGRHGEWIEVVSTLLALAILLPMTHSILGAKEARHWLGFLGKKLTQVQTTPDPSQRFWGRNVLLVGISFLATYREMVETILFYRGTLHDGGPFAEQALMGGVTVGVFVIFILAAVMNMTGKRLNPKPMMRISSIFLGLFCVVLAGQAIHSFQELGFLGAHLIASIPSLPFIGVYGNWEGILVQWLILLVVFAPSVVIWLKKKWVFSKEQ